jgi:hypothetical protein
VNREMSVPPDGALRWHLPLPVRVRGALALPISLAIPPWGHLISAAHSAATYRLSNTIRSYAG